MKYPLTERAVKAAFSELHPESISLNKKPGWHEASVDGEWPLHRLREHFKTLGFTPVGEPHQLLFVNAEQTVGLQCMGVLPDRKRNAWRKYCVEVQARTAGAAALSASRHLWP